MPRFDPDDEESRPVPHPLDRPWIHPSELGSGGPPGPPRPVAGPPARRPRRGRDVLIAVTAGAMGALATVTLLSLGGAFDRDPAAAPRAAATPAATNAAEVATRVAPGIGAVVTALGTTDERRGSGIVVGPHQVLTTADVVAPAAMGLPVRVLVGDGKALEADVRAVDDLTGLAVVEVPHHTLRPAQLAGSPSVRAGDWIVVVGRTPTNGPWVSSGVVTATGGWTRDAAGNAHPGLITTNTDLTEDARGGALVDAGGHIVGILAMVNAGSERAVAMPADMAGDVANQLTTKGRATHGALGVRASDASGGPVVAAVDGDTAAARAGLRTGDRIVAIDGTTVPDTATLVYELRRREAGARAVLGVQRHGKDLRIAVTLDDAARAGTGATTLALSAGTG